MCLSVGLPVCLSMCTCVLFPHDSCPLPRCLCRSQAVGPSSVYMYICWYLSRVSDQKWVYYQGPQNANGGKILRHPGMGCTTTSQTDPPPRLQLLGANWRPWHLKLKLALSKKVGFTAEVVTQNLGRRCIWAELQETGGRSATLAVNRLGRCRATLPSALAGDTSFAIVSLT